MESVLHLILSNKLQVFNANKQVTDFLKQKLTVDNPEYNNAIKLNLSIWWKSSKLFYYEIKNLNNNLYLEVPRGILANLFVFLWQNNIQYTFEDLRQGAKSYEYNSSINLRPHQFAPVEQLVNMQQGILVSPAWSWKTVMMLDVINKKKTNAFVAVHTSELLNQFKERAITNLNLKPEEIGIISEGKVDLKEKLTIWLIQTISQLSDKEIQEITNKFGIVFIDECHHVPAESFLNFSKNVKSPFFFWATATLKRLDGLDKVLEFYIGPVLYEIPIEQLHEANLLMKPTLIPRFTEFSKPQLYEEWKKNKQRPNHWRLLTEVVNDLKRNQMIIQDLVTEATNWNYCIVLSKRKEHLYTLNELMPEKDLNGKVINKTVLVSGSIKKKEKELWKEKINNKETQIIFAIDKLAGEGLDIPHLNCVMLATPVGNLKDAEQFSGRVSRIHPWKTEAKVYDYIDQDAGYMDWILWKQFKDRYWGYYKKNCVSPNIDFNKKTK